MCYLLVDAFKCGHKFLNRALYCPQPETCTVLAAQEEEERKLQLAKVQGTETAKEQPTNTEGTVTSENNQEKAGKIKTTVDKQENTNENKDSNETQPKTKAPDFHQAMHAVQKWDISCPTCTKASEYPSNESDKSGSSRLVNGIDMSNIEYWEPPPAKVPAQVPIQALTSTNTSASTS